MSSEIFKKIYENKINSFIKYFSEEAVDLFFEGDRLIHPGEYGKYREEAVKNILKIVLDKTISLSDGFIISKNNAITTQCDVIGYNSLVSPLITDGISKMFPSEEIYFIGEVKSTLSKRAYIESLRKLSSNKKRVLDSRENGVPMRYKSKTYNTVITFLICSELEFDYKKLDYEEIYENIERKYWHNCILSVKDGYFGYALDFRKASEDVQEKLLQAGYILDNLANVPYPVDYFGDEVIDTRENHIYYNDQDKYRHINHFLVAVSTFSNELWRYSYDPVQYLGLNKQPFFFENDK